MNVAHPVCSLEKALDQAGAQSFIDFRFDHCLIHAGHPLVALADPDGERKVAHAQAWMPESLLIMPRST